MQSDELKVPPLSEGRAARSTECWPDCANACWCPRHHCRRSAGLGGRRGRDLPRSAAPCAGRALALSVRTTRAHARTLSASLARNEHARAERARARPTAPAHPLTTRRASALAAPSRQPRAPRMRKRLRRPRASRAPHAPRARPLELRPSTCLTAPDAHRGRAVQHSSRQRPLALAPPNFLPRPHRERARELVRRQRGRQRARATERGAPGAGAWCDELPGARAAPRPPPGAARATRARRRADGNAVRLGSAANAAAAIAAAVPSTAIGRRRCRHASP